MAEYALIHPERPLRRAAVAVAVALCVHLGAFGLVRIWALGLLEAARKAEAERPKEVALAQLDAAQWDKNREVASRIAKVEPSRIVEEVTRVIPAAGQPGRPSPEGKDAMRLPGTSPTGWAASESSKNPSPADSATGLAPAGPTMDLQPRPIPGRQLAMKFDQVGTGGTPYTEGTGFGSFRVLNPEAWRYTNFFGRAVETMSAVYRYDMGTPMPPSLHAQWLTNPVRGGGCSWTLVSLDSSGRVVDAHVRRSSGMPDLDALIVEVIRRSAPLANVPPGLLDANGIYTDSWGLCISWGDFRG